MSETAPELGDVKVMDREVLENQNSNQSAKPESLGTETQILAQGIKQEAEAVQPPDDALSKYLESLKAQMEASFGAINNMLSNLDNKYVELAQQVKAGPSAQPDAPNAIVPVNVTPVAPLNQASVPTSPAAGLAALVQGYSSTLKNLEVQVEQKLNHRLIAGPSDKLSEQPQLDSSSTLRHSPVGEPYRIRTIDALRLHPLAKKLENEEEYKYWKRSIVGLIETQEVFFVLDPSEIPPSTFTQNDLMVAKRRVRYFIFESLSPYFQDLVADLLDPKEMMDKLEGVCNLASTLPLKKLVNDFNSIHFNPKSETANEFLGRFDELRKKIASLNPNLLTHEHVKRTFEGAIDETETYEKAELHGFKLPLAEMREMLVEEQLRNESSPAVESSFSDIQIKTPSFRGRGGVRGMRRGSRIRGIPRTSNPVGIAASSKPPFTKRDFCVYCKRRGHSRDVCHRALKSCFFCGKAEHFAADCPLNTKKRQPSAPQGSSSSYNPPQNETPVELGKPKLFKMPLGHARKLSQEFRTHPNSVFSFAQPPNAPDTQDVWVTMGDTEEMQVSMLNFINERQGSDQRILMSRDDDDEEL